jgi:hypothetical protein
VSLNLVYISLVSVRSLSIVTKSSIVSRKSTVPGSVTSTAKFRKVFRSESKVDSQVAQFGQILGVELSLSGDGSHDLENAPACLLREPFGCELGGLIVGGPQVLEFGLIPYCIWIKGALRMAPTEEPGKSVPIVKEFELLNVLLS